MNTDALKTASMWLNSPTLNEADKQLIRDMISNNPSELEEAFYSNLEFGTGGLRGIMGIGTNRMNKYTVGMATQGLANYILKQFHHGSSVAIACDSRNNSDAFTAVTADVLSANGIKVFLFDDIRPVPLLSFAVRNLQCSAGIMITASHNPKEYNGYKVYWSDGGQLVEPHDRNVIAEVRKISSPDEVKFEGNQSYISIIGDEMDELYFDMLKKISLRPDLCSKFSELKIVYTPLHGTGYHILPEALKRFGFNRIIDVPPQNIPDGNFPTVVSPNPEEKAGLQMAIDKAIEMDADILMATDPDADRLGVGVKTAVGEYMLLNGNQTAALLTYYILKTRKELHWADSNDMIVKTIVTTDLLSDIAKAYDVHSFEVLTGFKYIADHILKSEGKYQYICGGEESYGFLAGDKVRDKDAVMTACLVAEAAAWAASEHKKLTDVLIDMAVQFGVYREGLISLTRKGIAGMQEIQQMMEFYRNEVPSVVAGKRVVRVLDYQLQKNCDVVSGHIANIDLPISNVIQYLLEDGSKITMRPSGTEPKIKFYFSVKGIIGSANQYNEECVRLDQFIADIQRIIPGSTN